jgi:hypothetical protein
LNVLAGENVIVAEKTVVRFGVVMHIEYPWSNRCVPYLPFKNDGAVQMIPWIGLVEVHQKRMRGPDVPFE